MRIVSFTSAIAVLALLLIVAGVGAYLTWLGPGPARRDTTVILQPGSGVSAIGARLEQAGVIGSAEVFRIAVQVSGADRSLRAGEYAFPARASLAQVVEQLREGRVVRHFVTIPEGRTSLQAIDLLNAESALTGTVEPPPEGSILPETYEYTRGESRAAVLQRMREARDKALAELWPKRAPDLPISTPEEAVILASIVEKETGVASERPRVASVFINRLNRGMRLESDPTVVYGVSPGRPLGRGLRLSELQRPTPYNTYLIAGLPPTPIANPGRAALAAVLNPPQSEDLFFVADGSGGHAFARTFEEHLRNVARWRAHERANPQVYADPAAPASGAPEAPVAPPAGAVNPPPVRR
jgi:UPF0755 protein